MMKALSLLLCFGIVVVGGSFVKDSFDKMDVNKDGFLEKGEIIPFLEEGFKRLAVMDADWLFKDMDKNKDEYVDMDEMADHNIKMTVEKAEAALKDGTMKKIDEMIYTYEKEKLGICDKNKDGKLSSNEYWYFLNSAATLPRFEHENMFLQYDLNKDGKVLFEEFHNPAYKAPNQSPEQQKAADQEFFNSRDMNHDGILDFIEVREMTNPNRARQAAVHLNFMLEKHDTDKDHRLSEKEFSNTAEDMSLFEGPGSQPPALRDDDVAGEPVDPPTKIDYEVFIAKGHDEL